MLELIRALVARRLEPAHWLLLAQLVMFTGIAALFPVVPLYVRGHGGTSADVALFVAGPLLASTLVQVPTGHLVDRVGRKPVLVGSRLVYGALSWALFANAGPLWALTLLRVAQGGAAGAYAPALRAALADLTPEGRRGTRYAQQQACEMVGMLAGPAIGGAVALWSLSGIFAVSGTAVLVGLTPLIRLPETRPVAAVRGVGRGAACAEATGPGGSRGRGEGEGRDGGDEEASAPRRWWWSRALVVPALSLAALWVVFNMYDVVWPLYLSSRGFDSLVIGISISIYAVPILLFAGWAGRLADRAYRRRLVPVAFVMVAACAVCYPLLRSLLPILLVGIVEAVAVVSIEPSLLAVVSEGTSPAMWGRAMGLVGFCEAAGGAVGAGILGALYGVAEPIPFLSGGTGCVLAALLCLIAMPARRRAAVERAAGMVPAPHPEAELV
jgi:DHA1 family multidrug resistance protein-like MFS transporter